MSEEGDTPAEGNDTMRCPRCTREFAHHFDLRQGPHVEYRCPCGQLLQWDYSSQSLAHSAWLIGPPQPCQHPEHLKPDALCPSRGLLTP